jgi:UDP-2,3-diacylglucosamine pyrophosphatase LpxH
VVVSQTALMRQYRTIWISDIHLGTRGCKADFLIDFLRYNDADTIYLVGDIIDGWRLKRSWYWPQTHNDVIQKVLRKVRKGTRVIYVPGNHDEWLRDYTLLQFGGVEVAEEVIHVTADGRRLLVLHGDMFDAVVKHARWLALLGDGAYTAALWVESCTALVEHSDGRLELVDWIEQWRSRPPMSAVVHEAEFEVDTRIPELVDTVS